MIDTQTEELITLPEAAKEVPGRPNNATLWRWRTGGVRGCKLETVLVGGRRFTSREALQRFFERTTANADGIPLERTSRQRMTDQSRATAALIEDGVLLTDGGTDDVLQ